MCENSMEVPSSSISGLACICTTSVIYNCWLSMCSESKCGRWTCPSNADTKVPFSGSHVVILTKEAKIKKELGGNWTNNHRNSQCDCSTLHNIVPPNHTWSRRMVEQWHWELWWLWVQFPPKSLDFFFPDQSQDYSLYTSVIDLVRTSNWKP